MKTIGVFKCYVFFTTFAK